MTERLLRLKKKSEIAERRGDWQKLFVLLTELYEEYDRLAHPLKGFESLQICIKKHLCGTKSLLLYSTDAYTDLQPFHKGLIEVMEADIRRILLKYKLSTKQLILWQYLFKGYYDMMTFCNEQGFSESYSFYKRRYMRIKLKLLCWAYFKNPFKLFGALVEIIFGYILGWVSNFGESLGRFFITCSTTALIFAFIYFHFDLLPATKSLACGDKLNQFIYSVYFSTGMLTSLGFEKIIPLGTAGRILVTIENIFGYLFLALLVACIGKKFFR